MATELEFFVMRRGSRWFVDVGRDNHGPYLTEKDAMADAIDAAHELSTKSRKAKVFLKKQQQDAVLVWTSGKDEYPPPEQIAEVEAE